MTAAKACRLLPFQYSWPSPSKKSCPGTGPRSPPLHAVIIAAKLSGEHEIEIWGDGEQTRSFMYIDDCTDGTIRLAASDIIEPLNIGSDELVSINRLVDIVEKIAGVKLKRSYKLDAPKGVRGRNSDNTLIKKLMNWAPAVRLEDGMEKTYKWIYDEMTSGKVSVVNALPKQALAAE